MYDELQFDKFVPDSDRMYRLSTGQTNKETPETYIGHHSLSNMTPVRFDAMLRAG